MAEYSEDVINDMFFSPKRELQNADCLVDIFCTFKKYFQESVRLFSQQLFAKLCIKYTPKARKQIQDILLKHQQILHEGYQIHLGELLLENNILDEAQIQQILKKMGDDIFFCALCKQYYHYYPFNVAKKPRCICCSGRLTPPMPEKKVLMQVFRSDFNVYYPFSKEADVPYGKFVFISPQEYLNKSLQDLEKEILSVFHSLHNWIQEIGGMPEEDPENAPSLITQAIKKQKRSSVQEEAEERNSELDCSHIEEHENFSMFFLGYLQNLEELLWLLSEMVLRNMLASSNIQEALELQQQYLDQSLQYSLAEALLEKNLMTVDEVYKLVSQVSHNIYQCNQCGHLFAKLFSERAGDACPKCGGKVEECYHPDKQILIQSLRIIFLNPFMLSTKVETAPSPFLFFVPNEGEYYSDSMFSSEYIHTALQRFFPTEIPEEQTNFSQADHLLQDNTQSNQEEQLLYVSDDMIEASNIDNDLDIEIMDVTPEQTEMLWNSSAQFAALEVQDYNEPKDENVPIQENLDIVDVNTDSSNSFWGTPEQPTESNNMQTAMVDESSAELEIVEIDEIDEADIAPKTQQNEVETSNNQEDWLLNLPASSELPDNIDNELLQQEMYLNTTGQEEQVVEEPQEEPEPQKIEKKEETFVDLRTEPELRAATEYIEKTQILTRAERRRQRRRKEEKRQNIILFSVIAILVIIVLVFAFCL